MMTLGSALLLAHLLKKKDDWSFPSETNETLKTQNVHIFLSEFVQHLVEGKDTLDNQDLSRNLWTLKEIVYLSFYT